MVYIIYGINIRIVGTSTLNILNTIYPPPNLRNVKYCGIYILIVLSPPQVIIV